MCLCSLLTSQTEISILFPLEGINKYHAKRADSKCQNTTWHSGKVSGGLLMSAAIKILINYEDEDSRVGGCGNS